MRGASLLLTGGMLALPIGAASGQRVSAVLIEADFGDGPAQRRPPGPLADQGGLAHGDQVAHGQRPQFALVVAAGQVFAAGVAGVAVADGERLFGDLLRSAPGGSAW